MPEQLDRLGAEQVRRRYRQTLRVIRGTVLRFKERSDAGEERRRPLLDIGPKTIEELLSQIVDDVEDAEKGESPERLV